MKAIVYTEHGSPDVLRCEEIEKPTPAEDEVLIKVRAASINPLDWRIMRGKPRIARVLMRMPKVKVPGVDTAGVVEAIGAKVTQWKPGDEVFGAARGSLAEYVCTKETNVARKPPNVSFEDAASCNVTGLTALQGLRERAQLQPGQRVLINGAAGGVGTFAVQIAKILGAHVTGVCSTRNVEMVRSIGADRVVDYTREDFTKGTERYDVIFDCVGSHRLRDYRRVMPPDGLWIAIGAPLHTLGQLLLGILRPLVYSRFVSQRFVLFMAKRSQDDLASLGELMSSGKLTPVIDRRYRLEETREAMRYAETGHVSGKLVVTL